MSTTLSSEQGAVYIVDPPDAIMKKFKSAVTDSAAMARSPSILAVLVVGDDHEFAGLEVLHSLLDCD